MARGRHPSSFARAGGQAVARAMLRDTKRTVLDAVALARQLGVQVEGKPISAPVSGPEYEKVILALHKAGVGHNLEGEAYTKRIVAGKGDYVRGNPATPKARRFVAAKIRTLRREGKPERAAVGEALAIGRRRGFRSIPKRPRRANPLAERNTIVSEREAWKAVESAALRILERKVGAATAGAIHGYAENIRNWAVVMLDQLKAGVHENPRRRANPVLGLIANESPAVFTVSKRVKEIVYIHAQDGEEYVHPFAPGVSATFLQDGRCVLWRRDGKPVGGRRIGNTIRPIGG